MIHHDDWYAACNRTKELEAENAALKEQIAELIGLKDLAPDTIRKQQHRIKVLREAIERVFEIKEVGWNKELTAISSILNAVLAIPDNTAELDALVRDAERYRSYTKTLFQDAGWPVAYQEAQTKEELDDAIDAAMKETP